jgi:2-polyprenyl-3-methyl-5-hydroxy-6-metoxy-1,4-benzoquinol methylase
VSGPETDVYAHANPYFLRAVGAHDRRAEVLDVGCWNGTLGRALIANSGAVVDGIEREPEQAAKALAAGYRNVAVADLDREIPESTALYDFVLFGDVLEHLVDPERVLATLAQRVIPGGRVLVSLPNVAFVANRLTHLLGRWDYQDYGILDRTHLRFFTKRTMIALLEESGLRLIRIDGYVGLKGYPWIISFLMRNLAHLWPSLFAIQIVLEAEKATQ